MVICTTEKCIDYKGNMITNYRFDKRTEKQFKEDILYCHSIEAEIAIRLGIFEFNETNKWPEITGLGTDHTGKFIKNTKFVTNDADYQIGERLVEITRSNTICKSSFHEKRGKIEKCINDGFDIVFVNGFLTSNPIFVWLRTETIEYFRNKSQKDFGIVKHPGTGLKPGYRFMIDWFKELWFPLPPINEKIPKEYNYLSKIAKKHQDEKKNQNIQSV